jgi:hypothetical protein
MAVEHYHVMFKRDFAEAPERLGGVIFGNLNDAAVAFTRIVGNGSPTRFRIVARAIARTGCILRSHHRKGLPYAYLAICRRTACDFNALAVTYLTHDQRGR